MAERLIISGLNKKALFMGDNDMNIILAIAFPPQSYKCCMKTGVMSMKKYLFNLNIFIVILWVCVGEFISTVLIGVPLTKALEKAFRDHLRELIE